MAPERSCKISVCGYLKINFDRNFESPFPPFLALEGMSSKGGKGNSRWPILCPVFFCSCMGLPMRKFLGLEKFFERFPICCV
jgi:hypothetical protein